MSAGHDMDQGALSRLLLRHQWADRRRRLADGRSAGIDAVGASALVQLRMRDMTAAALARRLGVGLAEATATLEALEHDGYVCRRAGADRPSAASFTATPLGASTLRPCAGAQDELPELDDGSAGRFLRRVALAAEREADVLARRVRDER